jgi:putative flippase GtrA
MTILEQFMGREATPLVQFLKYAIAGGIATAVHITIFHMVAWKLFPALQPNDWFVKLFRVETMPEDDQMRARNSMRSNWIAFLISNMVVYLINIAWVFEPGRHPWFIELLLFYLVSAVSIVLGTSLMGWLIRRFGMLTTFAFGANLVTALLINYALRKFVIFKG